MQIPAGIFTTILGGKIVMGVGVGFAGFLTLFTPLCARLGPSALITLRVFQGIISVCIANYFLLLDRIN
jgi:hypothetical protein